MLAYVADVLRSGVAPADIRANLYPGAVVSLTSVETAIVD
ncbi:hypothetical protein SAMN05192558_109258 [Actinokineospora alba]|uniref:Uncharacterized protein n=1 Tax=Actinokineospora alba TaxID=504798 RepID=A0A1H0T4N5_9PSEU|nr:hypothetical protein C8E96_1882 [Actinokineospora alba]SDJ23442.1 hypothetical protein SAMN05421871_111116 [Actinokineospora alba]SDP48785.1 hypothetical protein SAMN05192558_109258 [Actinokineospora alba]